jgi:uncharacterized protein
MKILFLFVAGIFAGFINTLAGGGSVLALPVLMLAGLDSTMANATNRIAILFQSTTGTMRFHKHKQLNIESVKHITIAAIIGSAIGSFFAVKIDSAIFDKIMGIVFIFILIMMLKPKPKASLKKLPKALEIIVFLIVGFYGGFIQAGIGFILLATLNLVENFSLVKANAVKVFIIMCYTIPAVVVFAVSGMLEYWYFGLILAAGNIIGTFIGVRAAVKQGDKVVKIVLATAIVLACLKLFGVFKLIGLG